jgi:hypothetical protein
MRLNRTLLYSGVFMTALGVALLAIDASSPSTSQLIEVLRLWPLVPIAAGLALVLRRTSFSLAGGLLAAAVPGLVLGGLLALSPRVAVDHGYWDEMRAVYRYYQQCHDVEPNLDFGNVQFDPSGGCK